ncbi:unnamed protein product [Withania somnifera]
MPMTAAGITKFSLRLRLIRSQRIKRRISTFSRWKENTEDKTETWSTHEAEEEIEKGDWWVPHPRTGIYFPIGQEKMMDDVPNGAASFPQTYWLRSEDGVDKPEQDSSFVNYRQHY